jgi:hypothetical protein
MMDALAVGYTVADLPAYINNLATPSFRSVLDSHSQHGTIPIDMPRK